MSFKEKCKKLKETVEKLHEERSIQNEEVETLKEDILH